MARAGDRSRSTRPTSTPCIFAPIPTISSTPSPRPRTISCCRATARSPRSWPGPQPVGGVDPRPAADPGLPLPPQLHRAADLRPGRLSHRRVAAAGFCREPEPHPGGQLPPHRSRAGDRAGPRRLRSHRTIGFERERARRRRRRALPVRLAQRPPGGCDPDDRSQRSGAVQPGRMEARTPLSARPGRQEPGVRPQGTLAVRRERTHLAHRRAGLHRSLGLPAAAGAPLQGGGVPRRRRRPRVPDPARRPGFGEPHRRQPRGRGRDHPRDQLVRLGLVELRDPRRTAARSVAAADLPRRRHPGAGRGVQAADLRGQRRRTPGSAPPQPAGRTGRQCPVLLRSARGHRRCPLAGDPRTGLPVVVVLVVPVAAGREPARRFGRERPR